MAEMRAETAIMLRNEASAVAVLDEQLWLTDQRLGQRIDDIAQVHLKDRLLSVDRERRAEPLVQTEKDTVIGYADGLLSAKKDFKTASLEFGTRTVQTQASLESCTNTLLGRASEVAARQSMLRKHY